MTQELTQVAKTVLLRSSGPMTIGQIRTAMEKEVKLPAADRFRKEVQPHLSEVPGIYTWPKYGANAVFCRRPLSVCIEEALLRALDEEPLTVSKAAKAVKKLLRYISEERTAKEMKALLPQQVSSGKIVRLALNRQSLVYLSRSWMAKQAPADAADGSLDAAMQAAVARLQSGPGSYVRIDRLRHAPEVRSLLDQAAIRLADVRQLVLARYDGPRPVPEDEKWNYVEDGSGELFIGVAIPRSKEAEE